MDNDLIADFVAITGASTGDAALYLEVCYLKPRSDFYRVDV